MSTNFLGLFESPSLDVFNQFATNITKEYIEDISNQINTKGEKPSFDDLFEKLKALNNDLALKVVQLVGSAGNEKEQVPPTLTEGFKEIIKKSNDDCLRTVKQLISENSKRDTNIKK